MSSGFSRLPLQKKVAMTLSLTIAAFAAISYMTLSEVIAPAFDELELEAARTDLVRVERAIGSDVANLEASTVDWTRWDDMYEYVNERNPAFARSNLIQSSLTNLGLDLLVVYADDSELLWGNLLVDGSGQPLATLGILQPDNPAHAVLTRHADAQSRTAGIVQTSLGPMIICSLPILMSDESGPVAGAVVMAHFLDDSRAAQLRERTEINLRWTPMEQVAAKRGIDVKKIGAAGVHMDTNAQWISSYKILSDIFSAPVLLLDTKTPRKISILGKRTVDVAMTFLLLAGLLVTIVMWYLLRKTILRPIGLLAAHMEKIRQSGDLSSALRMDSDDEVGALAAQFNRLTAEVHEARKALLFQSFKAGKADTAAEVLHNIRNAMTPMINGVERLSRALRATDELRVSDAVAQMRDAHCPEERKAKLVDYIEASFDHIRNKNVESVDDVRIVMSQARQVEAILSDQEKFANATPIAENICVDEVVDEAAHVIPKDAKKTVAITLDDNLREFRVHAHRIGLLQVLGNLILNAYESIQRARISHGHIYLSACKENVGEKSMVRLTVKDNGTGFEQGASTRVFQRGFTSKGEGDTTGLGLHWCANAVAGMGGRISAESNGSGAGAEFHVLLPAAEGGFHEC